MLPYHGLSRSDSCKAFNRALRALDNETEPQSAVAKAAQQIDAFMAQEPVPRGLRLWAKSVTAQISPASRRCIQQAITQLLDNRTPGHRAARALCKDEASTLGRSPVQVPEGVEGLAEVAQGMADDLQTLAGRARKNEAQATTDAFRQTIVSLDPTALRAVYLCKALTPQQIEAAKSLLQQSDFASVINVFRAALTDLNPLAVLHDALADQSARHEPYAHLAKSVERFLRHIGAADFLTEQVGALLSANSNENVTADLLLRMVRAILRQAGPKVERALRETDQARLFAQLESPNLRAYFARSSEVQETFMKDFQGCIKVAMEMRLKAANQSAVLPSCAFSG